MAANMLEKIYEHLLPVEKKDVDRALTAFVNLVEKHDTTRSTLDSGTQPDANVALRICLPPVELGGKIAPHCPGGEPDPASVVTLAFQQLIGNVDAVLSYYLSQVIHTTKFQTLEATWRGLRYLVTNTETGTSLKIKVFSATKDELRKDFDKAVDFDQSLIFKKVYSDQYGSPGGEPFSVLLGDYYFSKSSGDLDLLKQIRSVAADAFAPFIAAPDPSMFGFKDWTEVNLPVDLATIFDSVLYAEWNSFRTHPDARFVALTMPRVLCRGSYGTLDQPIENFRFEELPLSEYPPAVAQKYANRSKDEDHTWANAAYYAGQLITSAFAKYGWTTAIRGYENGGQVEELPMHYFYNHESGNVEAVCPTEVPLTDRREYELDKLGFLSLSYYRGTNYAVFFGGQSTQKPLKYDNTNATDNAAISARMPYILATSRIAHYLKVIGRDKIGSFMELADVQSWLNRWIANYICADKFPTEDAKRTFPLAEAKINVTPVAGSPGAYAAVAWLRPFLQFEELTASLRLVVNIPAAAG